MILLLGSHGYIGSVFAAALNGRQLDWKPVNYKEIRYCFETFGRYATDDGIELIINCAAFIPPKSVADCDIYQAETIIGNVLLPSHLANFCNWMDIPLAQISTGCLWSDGQEHGEDDLPQRAFTGHCGFYIGTKVLAEEEVKKCHRHYIWRVRLPFDEIDCDRNYLSKLARFDQVFDHENTLCHRSDFVNACLDLYEMKAPWGTYNVMNPGSVKASEIVRQLQAHGIRTTEPKIVSGPQGGAKVSAKKMLDLGIKIRPVEEALRMSIGYWIPQK